MPINNKTEYIRPSLIIIGERQRSETKTEGLINSIKQYGILNAIIVNKISDGIYLVAGHRRLACAIELELPLVPICYYDTLDPAELKLIELEENIKREDLPWKDHVSAIGNFHTTKKEFDKEWNTNKTAEALSYTSRQIDNVLSVFNHLTDSDINTADNISHAIGILQRKAERRSSSIVEELLRAPSNNVPIQQQLENLNDALVKDVLNTSDEEILAEAREDGINPEHVKIILKNQFEDIVKRTAIITPPIIVTDFISWSETYSGPKFNLIHCDFPYGVNASDATIEHYENNKNLFSNLTNAFVANIDNFASYSSHVMFWLSFEYYEEVKSKLRSCGLHVINRPLIWVRSDSRGAAPGIRGTQPRHSYEICLLSYRGNRPLVRQGTDSYAAPTVTSPIHPTQKPESMLKHFLSMLVDNVTDFLDPTAGSGSSLRAAEELNARSTLGLEINPEYASAANALTLRDRAKRKVSENLLKTETQIKAEYENESEPELEL